MASQSPARNRCQVTLIATHLYRLKGLAVSEKTIQMFWRTYGVRPDRPTYRHLKADPARQAADQQGLQACKKAEAGNGSCRVKMRYASRWDRRCGRPWS